MRANIAWLKKFRLKQRRKKTKLTDLPFDILVNILKRLPVTSLCRIRCVSEILKNIVDDQSFVTLHTRLLVATNAVAEVPQLILNNDFRVTSLAAVQLREYNGNSSLKESKHAIVSELGLTSFSIRIIQQFVFCNLFCFKVGNCGSPYCILFDPFKGEVLPLPMSDVQVSKEDYINDKYGIGFDDLTSTHKMIRVSADIQNNMVAQLLVLGTSSWRKIHWVPPHRISSSTSLLSANGDMHWLIHLAYQFSSKREPYNFFRLQERGVLLHSTSYSINLEYAPTNPERMYGINGSHGYACWDMGAEKL